MPGFELIGKEEKEAVSDIFEKGGVLCRYGLDAKRQYVYRVDDFEKEIAKKTKAKYCHCVSSGSGALAASLYALGLKPGDEVITQSFTFVATIEAIMLLGGVPVITEIDKSLNMDPADLERKITDKTKVIIPVHMGGGPAKMDEIMAIAQKHDLKVLEDAAQSFGASYKGKALGAIGQAGVFSFDIGKVITTGEGGAVVTNEEQIYKKVREYSDHGHECNPNVPRAEDTRNYWGFTFRMSELQGAVGLAQIKKMDYILKKQKENYEKIKQCIEGIKAIEFREMPDPEGDAKDTLFFFVESGEKAKKLDKILASKGIGTKNVPSAFKWHFAATWNHILPYSETYKSKDLMSEWPKSYDLVSRSIAIPIMVNWDEEQIKKTIENIRESLEEMER